MVEVFVVKFNEGKDNGKVKVFKYMMPNGVNVEFDEEKECIDFLPLEEYVGEEIKIVILENEDIEALGDADVKMAILVSVTEDEIELDFN